MKDVVGLSLLKKKHKMSGEKFGELTLTGRIFRGEISGCTRSVVECVCSCGSIFYPRFQRLINGRTISCGCVTRRKKNTVGKKRKYRPYIPVPIEQRKKRGRVGINQDQRCYETYKAMKRRCQDEKHHSFHNYGGRGITVCEEWATFQGFFKDMGPRPLGKELDRIDCDGGYNKENCRWVTRTENMRNRRNSKVKKIAQL